MVETRTMALPRPTVATPGHGCLSTLLVATVQNQAGKIKPTYKLTALRPTEEPSAATTAPPANKHPAGGAASGESKPPEAAAGPVDLNPSGDPKPGS